MGSVRGRDAAGDADPNNSAGISSSPLFSAFGNKHRYTLLCSNAGRTLSCAPFQVIEKDEPWDHETLFQQLAVDLVQEPTDNDGPQAKR